MTHLPYLVPRSSSTLTYVSHRTRLCSLTDRLCGLRTVRLMVRTRVTLTLFTLMCYSVFVESTPVVSMCSIARWAYSVFVTITNTTYSIPSCILSTHEENMFLLDSLCFSMQTQHTDDQGLGLLLQGRNTIRDSLCTQSETPLGSGVESFPMALLLQKFQRRSPVMCLSGKPGVSCCFSVFFLKDPKCIFCPPQILRFLCV